MRTLALLVIGTIATPAAAFTQVRYLSPAPSALFQAATRGPLHAGAPRETQDSVTRYIQATHWKEGALVGAGVGALGGYGLSRLICEDRESTDSCGAQGDSADLPARDEPLEPGIVLEPGPGGVDPEPPG